MTFTPRTRFVNPRLGTYFGIFASALAAVFFLAAIFGQLGISDAVLRNMMLLGPIALYSAIGIASATSQPLDYFAAGRRVTPTCHRRAPPSLRPATRTTQSGWRRIRSTSPTWTP